MTWLNNLSMGWSIALLRGLWQGTLLAVIVWIICRMIPRMGPTVRSWLWWIVCAKFIFAVLIAPLIPLAVLPPTPLMHYYQAHSDGRPFMSPAEESSRNGSAFALSTDTSAPAVILVDHRATKPVARASTIPARNIKLLPSITSALLIVWLFGITVITALAARKTAKLVGIVHRGHLVNGRTPAVLSAQSSSSVQACVSDEIESVCVFGLFNPIILLPSSWVAESTSAEIEMAIAHEMAHIRRGDLWLDIVPSLAAIAFFFAPPARFAAEACRQYREEACDAAAIRNAGCSLSEYSYMLLHTAKLAPSVPGALGLSPAYRQLHARITGLKSSRQPIPKGIKLAATAVTIALLIAMAPWRLMARAARNLPEKMAAAVRYDIIDIGPVGGDFASQFHINSHNQVIGTSDGHPFLWQNGRMQPIGTERHNGRGGAINDLGTSVVTMYSSMGNPHAFYMGEHAYQLRGLPRYQFTTARAINNSGLIVGSAQHSGIDGTGSEIARAVLIDGDRGGGGRAHDLGTLGGQYSAAYAINSTGQVVGKADLPPTTNGIHPTHAFLWRSPRAMQDLGTLGGTNSFAYAINDSGVVAGFSLLPGDKYRHACVWSGSSGTSVNAADLGPLPGDTVSEAHGVNNDGVIVGTSDTLPNAAGNRAVLWRGSAPIDLNTAALSSKGWHLMDAMAINNQGTIVGKGTLKGKAHAFLLVPIRTK